MPGRFPLFTDENIDGPIIRGLRQRGWDVQHATKELGEETKDAPLFQLAASLDRVFVSTDRHMLQLAKKWLEVNRPFRMIWWEQSETQRILASAQITKDPRVCGGKACIDNTRIRVIDIVQLESEGYGPEQM